MISPTFFTDYIVLVFFASVGVLQVAASFGRLTGLLILKPPRVARISGLVLAAGAFVWFFASGPRNVNDVEGGLNGNTQALAMFLGVLGGLAATLVVSSLVNFRMNGSPASPSEGLDSLRRTTYIRALLQNLGTLWTDFYRLTRTYFSG